MITPPLTRPPGRPRGGWRTGVVAVATASLVVTGMAVGLQQANAATVDTNASYVLVSRLSGHAVDVLDHGTTDGTAIIQWSRTNAPNQQWQFVDSGGGFYRLKSRLSGKVLDVAERSTADGANVVQWTDTNATNQQFRLVDSSGGYVRLINRNSGKALDVWERSTAPGTRISQYTDLNGTGQQWQLVKVGGSNPPPPPPGGGGGPVTGWPAKKGDTNVSGTIKVATSLDGGMRRYCCMGDGSGSESQDAMFDLAPGAVLQNVIIGAPAGDGVHCSASCTLRNVWWEDVGEDAATLLGAAPAGSVMTIDGGGARKAGDKVFQHNGRGTMIIKNFFVDDFGKLYRSCGNCNEKNGKYQGPRNVVIDNIVAQNGRSGLVGINDTYTHTSGGDTARLSRVTIVGDPGRKLAICQRFTGNNSGKEPPKSGTGPNSNCIYSASDISYR